MLQKSVMHLKSSKEILQEVFTLIFICVYWSQNQDLNQFYWELLRRLIKGSVPHTGQITKLEEAINSFEMGGVFYTRGMQ